MSIPSANISPCSHAVCQIIRAVRYKTGDAADTVTSRTENDLETCINQTNTQNDMHLCEGEQTNHATKRPLVHDRLLSSRLPLSPIDPSIHPSRHQRASHRISDARIAAAVNHIGGHGLRLPIRCNGIRNPSSLLSTSNATLDISFMFITMLVASDRLNHPPHAPIFGESKSCILLLAHFHIPAPAKETNRSISNLATQYKLQLLQ